MLEDNQLAESAEDLGASASTIKAVDVSQKIVIGANEAKINLQDLEDSQHRVVDDYTSGAPQSVIVKNKHISERALHENTDLALMQESSPSYNEGGRVNTMHSV